MALAMSLSYDLRSVATRRMHQTTVRFGADLWAEIEREAASTGVSVAQYVREAALARLIYTAATRGDAEFALALDVATGRDDLDAARQLPADPLPAPSSDAAARALKHAEAEQSSSAALWAQGKQARLRARQLREQVARRKSS